MPKRTHIVIPEDLATQIDALVGKRGRSQFLTQAARKEVQRRRQLRAIENATGAWKDKDYPEMKQGAARWVEKLRRLDERRFTRLKSR
jgi:hypothetical protein